MMDDVGKFGLGGAKAKLPRTRCYKVNSMADTKSVINWYKLLGTLLF